VPVAEEKTLGETRLSQETSSPLDMIIWDSTWFVWGFCSCNLWYFCIKNSSV